MILRFGVGVTLAVLICVLVMILFGWLWKKMNKKIAAGATIGGFVGIIGSVAIVIIPSRAYVITGAKEYKHHLVHNNSDYTMSSGQEVELNSSS